MYVAYVIYGIRLFSVVLQELQCLLNYLHVSIIRAMGSVSFMNAYSVLIQMKFDVH